MWRELFIMEELLIMEAKGEKIDHQQNIEKDNRNNLDFPQVAHSGLILQPFLKRKLTSPL